MVNQNLHIRTLESNISVCNSTEVKPKLTKPGYVILQGRNRDKKTRACIIQRIKQNLQTPGPGNQGDQFVLSDPDHPYINNTRVGIQSDKQNFVAVI